MNAYEIKQEARRERLEARADKLRTQGEARVDRAHKMAEAIPFGQPILVGHHSEGRDRNYRGKIEGGFRKGFEQIKAAGEAAAKAAAVGTGGISADDPDAVVKLKAELVELEASQAKMKAANAAIRKHKAAGPEAQVAALAALGYGAAMAGTLLSPDFCGRIGFADYQITNNGANVRRIKQRIEQLQAQALAQPKVTEAPAPGIEEVFENVEANRLQIMFSGKPSPAMIKELKSYGFKWAPSVGAWQRQLNNAARWAAERIVCKAKEVSE